MYSVDTSKNLKVVLHLFKKCLYIFRWYRV